MDCKPKILLVDDEKRFIDSLSNILGHYEYDCTKAFSGTMAINLLQQSRYDVAILDVGLPDMSGCDIAEFIKKFCARTTAIMLTGQNTVETAVRSIKLGAYDFLKKPINHDILLKTIEKALEHNKLTKDLGVSEKRFQALAEAAWEGIVIHEDGKIIEVNSRFLEIFGYSLQDIANGLSVEEIFTPNSSSDVKKYFTGTDLKSFDILGVRKDRTQFPIEVKSRIIDYVDRPARVLALRDISTRVQAEREKLALQKKLAKANKLNALGLMAGSVAHDLNNILTAVVSYPDLLLMQMSPEDKHYTEIKKIQDAGKRAAAVVSDLVSIARGSIQQTSLGNLNDIIQTHLSSIEHSERLAKYPKVTITTDLQHGLYDMYCSHQHIHKILLNLIGNALEAVKDSGLIHISTQNCLFSNPVSAKKSLLGNGDYIKLMVSDDGPGISDEDRERIFDPFYSTKKMGKSGTGLGLAVVWNTVREHNGWVEVVNNNPGALFQIWLPATKENKNDRQDRQRPVDVDVLQGNGEKILLVDDDPVQTQTIEIMLNSLGYQTFSAASGEEGVEILRNREIDLVLLDMIMGDGLNGRETFEEMLRIKTALKGIIISGYAKEEEITAAKSLGVSHILEKPITLTDIGKVVNEALAI